MTQNVSESMLRHFCSYLSEYLEISNPPSYIGKHICKLEEIVNISSFFDAGFKREKVGF